jgi:hypothetical protein
LPLVAVEQLVVQLVVVVELGACQKFPQPARSGAAASNSRANFLIFIVAPLFLPPSAPSNPKAAFRLSPGGASCL